MAAFVPTARQDLTIVAPRFWRAQRRISRAHSDAHILPGRTPMRHTFMFAAATLAFLSFAAHAVAQEKQHVSFKSTAENSKYTQQLNVDVGDVGNHIVRAFDLHRTYPANQPVIGGLKLAQEWNRGIADLTDGTGTSTLYGVYLMDNGDKFFTRTATVVESGSGKLTATQVGTISGGTGKLAGIRGTVKSITTFDPKSGFNENQTDMNYSIGK
jgi:hypothetical protein